MQYREVVANGQKTRVYKYLVLVDTADFAKKDKEGSYAIDNSKLGTLKNTVVHELMHAFMDDYTRTGMACELELSAAEAKARENMSATQ